jgi:hypothetical protein
MRGPPSLPLLKLSGLTPSNAHGRYLEDQARHPRDDESLKAVLLGLIAGRS